MKKGKIVFFCKAILLMVLSCALTAPNVSSETLTIKNNFNLKQGYPRLQEEKIVKYYNQVQDWRRREATEQFDRKVLHSIISGTEIKSCPDDLSRLQMIKDAVLEKIEYAHDIDVYHKDEHWATTREILANMRGDCEDRAALIYRLIIEMSGCFDDKGVADRSGMLFVDVLRVPVITAHMFAVVRLSGYKNFFIVDTTNYSDDVVEANQFLFENLYILPTVAYNLNDFFTYQKVVDTNNPQN